MQPHSMVAVYAAHRIWPFKEGLSYCEVRVVYDKENHTETKYYHCYINRDSENTVIAKIRRQGGDGLSCEVKIKKTSDTKYEMTHGTQHIAGLREEFDFSYNREEVRNGRHYNSLRYGPFSGDLGKDKESLKLECSLKMDDGSFKKVKYELKVTSRKIDKDPKANFTKMAAKSF